MAQWCDTTEFLAEWAKNQAATGPLTYEHRLLLSGCGYNADLLGDASRSDLGRILLLEPVELLTAALPFSEYPQELVLRISVREKARTSGAQTVSYAPHREIVGGIVALLSIYLRRLVTHGGTNTVETSDWIPAHPILKRLPIPIVSSSKQATFWSKLPLNSLTSVDGTTLHNPNPEAVGVSPEKLRLFLLQIGKHPQAKKIIDAARSYHRGLELLFDHPDISYLCFIFAADALAHAAFPSVERSEQERLDLRISQNLQAAASKLGLPADQIKALCLTATDSIRHKQRGELFALFLRQYGVGHTSAPWIFNFENSAQIFKVADEDAAIKLAYATRSGHVHTATPIRDSALLGTSSRMSVFASMELFVNEDRAPPIVWLERILAQSFLTFVNTSKPTA